MADNKQYVTLAAENGSVMISEDVVAAIATHALTDIEGYAGLFTKNAGDFAELLGNKNWNKGVKVFVTEENTVVVECNVLVVFGSDIIAVSKAIQDAVVTAVTSTTGAKMEAVNVNICGIVCK